MNRKPLPQIAMISLCLISCSGQTTSNGPENKPGKIVLDEVDHYMRSQMFARYVPGISLAVLRDGKILKLKGYGVANAESKEPATEDTVYRLASTTKLFTATAVMKLVETGKLSLKDRIGDLLPDLPGPWRPVTVHQLLSHTSGLPDVITDPSASTFTGKTRDEALKLAAENAPRSKPGERFDYNQTGYLLLGMIIETLSHQKFTDFMSNEFFSSLGMGSTRFGDIKQLLIGDALPYTNIKVNPDGSSVRLEKTQHSPFRYWDYEAPCATLQSSVRDLAKWDIALSEGRILKPSTLDQMWKTALGSEFRYGDQQFGYGCGWYIGGNPGHKMVWHSGGASTIYKRYLDDHLTVIILTNCAGAVPDQFVDDLAAFYIPARSNTAEDQR